MKDYNLRHFIKDGSYCDFWNHVGTYAVQTQAEAEAKIAELRARFPNDAARFECDLLSYDLQLPSRLI